MSSVLLRLSELFVVPLHSRTRVTPWLSEFESVWIWLSQFEAVLNYLLSSESAKWYTKMLVGSNCSSLDFDKQRLGRCNLTSVLEIFFLGPSAVKRDFWGAVDGSDEDIAC